MTGVIITSHGSLAEGFVHACKMLRGFDLTQTEAVCLGESDSTDTFLEHLKDAICRLDVGDGVVIFADLPGGTPCNLSRLLLSERVRLIAGANLPLILEFLSEREDGNVDLDELIDDSRGTIHLVEPTAVLAQDDEEEL